MSEVKKQDRSDKRPLPPLYSTLHYSSTPTTVFASEVSTKAWNNVLSTGHEHRKKKWVKVRGCLVIILKY